MNIIFLPILVIIMIGLMTPNAFADEQIPNWVKYTAGWWATDAISEEEFVNAIEFLIYAEIIHVSVTPNIEDSQDMPEWVKNTAGWWATDAISEEEFVNAIEFLVKNQIIIVFSDDNVSKEYTTMEEIMLDDSLSSKERLIEIDRIFPFMSGYRGAAFDGEYVYYSPYYNNHERHAGMLRYDISQDFQNHNAWEPFNLPPKISAMHDGIEIEVNISGFQGALYKEPFVYYVPYHVDNGYGSVVLRYDTNMQFDNFEAYAYHGLFDVYEDGVVHKNFIYFSPHLDYKNEINTFPLRYDTQKPFGLHTSWEKHSLENNTSYIGAESAMDKIFYAPWNTNTSINSTIAIYDTHGSFTDNSSWELIDIPYDGYTGAAFNGEHVVFVSIWCSFNECDEGHSNFIFLEPNTLEISYLEIPNASYNGIINARGILYPVPYSLDVDPVFLKMDGFQTESFTPSIAKSAYWGGVFDGKYVYYSPYQFVNSDKRSNEFLRYDTTKIFTDEYAWESIKIQISDFVFEVAE